jgi:hypothetical protein
MKNKSDINKVLIKENLEMKKALEEMKLKMNI